MRNTRFITAVRPRKVLRHPLPSAEAPAQEARSNRAPPDWADAVQAATGRLAERQPLRDTADYPVQSETAQRLAALVIAYGELEEEVRRQATRNEPPAGSAQPETALAD